MRWARKFTFIAHFTRVSLSRCKRCVRSAALASLRRAQKGYGPVYSATRLKSVCALTRHHGLGDVTYPFPPHMTCRRRAADIGASAYPVRQPRHRGLPHTHTLMRVNFEAGGRVCGEDDGRKNKKLKKDSIYNENKTQEEIKRK